MSERIDIVVSPDRDEQALAAAALELGLRLHGYRPQRVAMAVQARSDIVACWGWRRAERLLRRARAVLVIERAYLSDRFSWVSLGWNGLNGHAVFPCVQDGGERLKKIAVDAYLRTGRKLMREWSARPEGYTLLLGQVPGDAAVRPLKLARSSMADWLGQTAAALKAAGHDVRFRAHPLAPQLECGAPRIEGTLEEALAGARCAVTYNSNSGVDAVLAGVPAVTMERGAMAWEVTSHALDAPLVRPDRTMWARRMAYTQWLPQEIGTGEALEHLLACMPQQRQPAAARVYDEAAEIRA